MKACPGEPCPVEPGASAAAGTGASTGGSAHVRPGASWRDDAGLHIEVRGLAPPGPLVAILRLIDGLPAPEPVIVHHDRDPQLLYPELAERGWMAERIAGEPGEVRLRLAKVDG